MNISPTFSIFPTVQSGGVAVKARLTLPADETFTVKSFIASVEATNFDDIAVEVADDGDDIAVLLHGGPGGKKARAATITPHEMDASQKASFLIRLSNAIDEAFGSAMFDATVAAQAPTAAAGVTVGSVTVGVPGGAKSGRPSRFALGVVIAAVFAGVSLMAYGYLRPKTDQTAQSAQSQIGGDSAMSARIREQIDQAVRNPSPTGGFNGTNVALETMKAMGLNPGKANAGCLVGAH